VKDFHFDFDAPFNSYATKGPIIVFHTYPNDLYTSWVLEYVNFLTSKSKKSNVWIVDCATFAPHKEMTSLALLKRFFLRTNQNSNLLLRYIAEKTSSELLTCRADWKGLKFALRISKAILMSPSTRAWLSLEKLPFSLRRSVHSSMSNKYGTLYYRPLFHFAGILARSLSYYSSLHRASEIIKQVRPKYVVVCNSRLPNSAAAVEAARELGIRILFLERGGTPGLYNVFEHSPHATRARTNACEQMWKKNSGEAGQVAREIASTYIELRRQIDPNSGKSWNHERKVSSYIDQVRNEGYSKVCVFYTTTELEVAVYGDETPQNDFADQGEALRALDEVLDLDWAIVVRRHPAKVRKFRKDPEAETWRGLSRKRIFWIEPSSRIDSYDIAERADLACHWDSSIGAEIVYMQTTPVLTFGPNFWNGEEIENVRNKEALIHTLSRKLRVAPIESALKWGLYSAMAGRPFSLVKWRRGQGFMWGLRFQDRAMKSKLLQQRANNR